VKTKPAIKFPADGIPGAVTFEERRAGRPTVTKQDCSDGVVAYIRHRRRNRGAISRPDYEHWRVGKPWPAASP
jgi:hypothetical protein